jgi:hypothetical protein
MQQKLGDKTVANSARCGSWPLQHIGAGLNDIEAKIGKRGYAVKLNESGGLTVMPSA